MSRLVLSRIEADISSLCICRKEHHRSRAKIGDRCLSQVSSTRRTLEDYRRYFNTPKCIEVEVYRSVYDPASDAAGISLVQPRDFRNRAAGAGANAAREGSKGLVPLKPKEDAPQGRFQRKVVSNDAVLEEVVELLTDIARRAADAGRQLTIVSLVTRFMFLCCPYLSQA